MRWTDAIARVRKPEITNLEAAGLLLFVRAAHRRYASKYGLAPFDVVGFALPVFGWQAQGDRLVTTKAQQRAPYVAADELWQAIDALASDLDELGQQFELVTPPMGTPEKFRKLAELVERELAGAGGVMGAISASEARKSVDRAHELAITNAKKSGAAFVFVQASADGSVFTDEGDRNVMDALLDQATADDQVLAAGLWEVATGKLVRQKAGALEVTASAPGQPPAPSPVEPSPPKKKPASGSSIGWLVLLALLASSRRKGARW